MTSSGWHGFETQSSAPEAQAAHALRDGRALADDDHAEVRQHPADALQELPSDRPQQGEVDDERV